MSARTTLAERNVDRAETLYEELKTVHGCDPFAIMAAFAVGDSVKLKLQTAADRAKLRRFIKVQKLSDSYRDEGRLVNDLELVPSGADRELELIPPEVRFAAAKELAVYCRPKLAATSFLGADGKMQTSNVIVYVPDNGRMPVPAQVSGKT